MSSTQKRLQGRKILIGTTPFDGHVNPLTGIAQFLLSEGADVRWYSSAAFQTKIERLGCQFYAFEAAPKIDVTNAIHFFQDRDLLSDPGAKANYDMEHFFVNMAPGAYEDIVRIYRKFPFDVFIADSTFTALPLVRNGLGVPVIAIGVIPLAEESADLGPFGPGFLPPTDKAEKVQYQTIRQTFLEHVFQSSIDAYCGILTQHGILHRRSILFDMLIKLSDRYLQIGVPSFEYTRSDTGKNVKFIGPLLPANPSATGNMWYDDRLRQYNKVVLVTQGTADPITEKLLEPTLEAFAGSDILVIATTAGNHTERLRERFDHKNIIIEDFIPFSQLLPYCDVYVTNGGYGGVMLSASLGVPMVTAGLHEGKAEICSRVGYFGYGINLRAETPSPDQIAIAVRDVIRDDSYRINLRRLQTEMKEYQPLEIILTEIQQLVALNRSSSHREQQIC